MENEQVKAIRKRHIIFALDEKNKFGLENMVGIFSRIVNGEELEKPSAIGRLVKDEDVWRFYPKPEFTYQSETLSIICDTLRYLEAGKLEVTKKGFKSSMIKFIDEGEEEGLSK